MQGRADWPRSSSSIATPTQPRGLTGVAFNYLFLVEEMGELATDMVKIWAEKQTPPREMAAARPNRWRRPLNRIGPPCVVNWTAGLYQLDNYTGIDLEQAYMEKMRQNISRTWPVERGRMEPAKTDEG